MKWIKRHRQFVSETQIEKNFMPVIVIEVDRPQMGACGTAWVPGGGQSFIVRSSELRYCLALSVEAEWNRDEYYPA
jgi:hypothetical protein